MDSVDKVLETNLDLMEKLNESEQRQSEIEKENMIWKEKIDYIVNHVQQSESKSEKKGFFKRLFNSF